MRILQVLRAACVVGLAACSAATSPPPSESQPTHTFLSFTSDPGDYIGQSESHRYALVDGSWRAQFDTSDGTGHINVYLSPPSGSWWWALDLAAPPGKSLSVGTYEAARRWPFNGPTQPGLGFYGSGRGCNTLTGRFVVLALTLEPDNTVDLLHATFEQHCEGASPALTGELAIVANPWR
jgi:hypothetical protein